MLDYVNGKAYTCTIMDTCKLFGDELTRWY